MSVHLLVHCDGRQESGRCRAFLTTGETTRPAARFTALETGWGTDADDDLCPSCLKRRLAR